MFKIIWVFIIVGMCFCKKTENLSIQEILAYGNGTWSSISDGFGSNSIEFKSNGDFTALKTEELLYLEGKGKYKIENEEIALSIEKEENQAPDQGKFDKKQFKCKIINQKEDIEFEYKLACGNQGDYYSRNLLSLDRVKKYLGKYEILSIATTKGKTIDNANFRIEPYDKGKLISCSFHKDNTGNDAPAEKTFIPKDRYIEILAKTKDKFKVQKWENYWYYIYVPTAVYEGENCGGINKGWVYGEFISF